jgi:NitT/TauT family transport system substrate-binding protein
MTIAGTAALCGIRATSASAEPPPETTTISLAHADVLCFNAPWYVAEELLRTEGFTDVQYISGLDSSAYDQALAAGQTYFGMTFAGQHVVQIDAGDPIVLIAGLHVGCYELFGTNRIRTLRDLNGKTVAVTSLGSGRHIFLASILAHIGLDIRKDVNLVTHPPAQAMRLLSEGKIDAFMAFPPEPQELRARKVGHVLLNTATDRPWSHYFCCTLAGNRDFVRAHPVATRRALRALLKAVDICADDPARAAQALVQRGVKTQRDYVLQAMQEIPWSRWRDYDPEDTVRFYTLRLHDVGMVKSTPQQIISEATDWRFLNQLRKELKG